MIERGIPRNERKQHDYEWHNKDLNNNKKEIKNNNRGIRKWWDGERRNNHIINLEKRENEWYKAFFQWLIDINGMPNRQG